MRLSGGRSRPGKRWRLRGSADFARRRKGINSIPKAQPTVFVAYAVEDLNVVRRLCEALGNAGCTPWLDKDRLMPGQNWTQSIERAIAEADAFVACFSQRSLTKRGMFQSELRHALECSKKRPLADVFLLPVRLERCTIPAQIADRVQYVDLFPDWERGVKRLVRSIRRAARARMEAKFSPI